MADKVELFVSGGSFVVYAISSLIMLGLVADLVLLPTTHNYIVGAGVAQIMIVGALVIGWLAHGAELDDFETSFAIASLLPVFIAPAFEYLPQLTQIAQDFRPVLQILLFVGMLWTGFVFIVGQTFSARGS